MQPAAKEAFACCFSAYKVEKQYSKIDDWDFVCKAKFQSPYERYGDASLHKVLKGQRFYAAPLFFRVSELE